MIDKEENNYKVHTAHTAIVRARVTSLSWHIAVPITTQSYTRKETERGRTHENNGRRGRDEDEVVMMIIPQLALMQS